MQWFVDSPLFTLFFCVGAGSLFGRIRFGPVSFGPAGALFVALALSAIEPDVALPPIVTSLSLCVFCYMVGIAAGPAFVSALRTGWQPVVMSLFAVAAMAAAALGVGKAFGFDIGTIAGAFSGARTATAALGAVQQQLAAGGPVPPQPAIGYAVAYPITVLLTILACSYLISVGKRKPTAEDRETVPPFVVRTLELVGDPALTVHGLSERYEAVVSRLTRNRQTVVAHDAEPLAAGDLLTITAREDVADRLIAELGLTTDLGDSERTAGDINAIGLGLGLTLGLILAFLKVPLPGGGTLVLGTATAPLVVGVILGAVGRTGPVVWTLPGNVANTLNQFSLLVFLVAVGTGAGSGLVKALSADGLQLVLLGLAISAAHALICVIGLRSVLGYGTARALGGLTGSQLNPAPYAYAMGKVPDQRVAVGYAVLFPVSMIVKVFLAQLMVVYF